MDIACHLKTSILVGTESNNIVTRGEEKYFNDLSKSILI